MLHQKYLCHRFLELLHALQPQAFATELALFYRQPAALCEQTKHLSVKSPMMLDPTSIIR